MKKYLFGLITILMLSGCATVQPKDYTKFNAAKPKSILIVPVVNRSVEVTAADYFLSTISIPLAENGYYVFPVNMVKRMLEDDDCLIHLLCIARQQKNFAIYLAQMRSCMLQLISGIHNTWYLQQW